MLVVDNLARPGMPTVSFSLAAGRCLAGMGPSGSGKTLLLRAIADLDPSTGSIALDGADKFSVPAPDWRRRISYVAAEPGWWATTPAEHFEDWEASASLADALLLSLDLADTPLSQLSTGERQRFALIRALVQTPAFLLLDESTGPLDAAATAATERLLRQRLDAGAGIILVTHDADQADRLSDNVLTLDNGKAKGGAA